MSEAKLFLWDHPASSYAQKVRTALREKGIPFDKKVPEGLGSGQSIPGFVDASPRLEVPALVDGDFTLFDSKVILGYLEDKYPDHPLLPKDPKERAIAKLIEEVCDTQYEAINWGLSEIDWSERATGELAEKMKAQAKAQTAEIHAWLTGYLGEKDFFNGSSFGYADLCVAPYINRTISYGVKLAEDSPLAKWHARIMEVPSVKETTDEMLAAIKKMGEGFRELFKPGTGRRREYRDHRLEWMVKSGGIDVVTKGLRDNTIRFSWPGGVSVTDTKSIPSGLIEV